jgi:hypothetical protein
VAAVCGVRLGFGNGSQFGSSGFGSVNYTGVGAIGSISNGLALIGIILIVAISVDSLQHQMKTTGIFKSSKRNKILLKYKTV